jgi:GNAT superfamily N-acetyltransferase
MATLPIQIQEVVTKRDLKAFIKFPWRIYKGDPNWVPPLISERLDYLNPEKNPFFTHAKAAFFLARQGREVVGTIAPFVNETPGRQTEQAVGGFGFFEVLEDYQVAQRLLDTAREWVRARGQALLRGPTNFTTNDTPGVLIKGADCPPVILEAHTPLYYQIFLERYGMKKWQDSYAWRVTRDQIGEELKNVPADLLRVVEAVRRRSNVTIRKLRMADWDQEVAIAYRLFDETLRHLPDHVPISPDQFHRMADSMRPFLDPDLALLAEVDGQVIGFCVAIPDFNRVLIHLNGRLFPIGWLKLLWYRRRIDVVSFKLMGILDRYRYRGIEAVLYSEAVRSVFEKGYQWLDGSLTSEFNPAVIYLAERLGAERYKCYRIYEIEV